MTNVEFSILYLSIGSAFGAHQYMLSVGNWVDRAPRAVAALTLWPVFILAAVINRSGFRSKFVFDAETKPDSLPPGFGSAKRQLEIALMHGKQSDDLFRLRDTLSRYTGLTVAENSEDDANKHCFLTLNEYTDSEIQSICLSRRNRNRLRRHRINARLEFIEAAIEFASGSADPEKAGAAAIDFARLLNDGEAVSLLQKHMDQLQKSPIAGVPGMESGTWITREHQST